MAERVWTANAIRALFTELPKIEVNGKLVGKYTSEWGTSPPNFSTKEWNSVGEALFNILS